MHGTRVPARLEARSSGDIEGMTSEQADGSSYRVEDEPGDEIADGSNYREDDAEREDPEIADGSSYTVKDEPGDEIADGSNYRPDTD